MTQMEDISRRRSEALTQYRVEYENKKEETNTDMSSNTPGIAGSTDPDSYDTVDLGCVVSYSPILGDKVNVKQLAVDPGVKIETPSVS